MAKRPELPDNVKNVVLPEVDLFKYINIKAGKALKDKIIEKNPNSKDLDWTKLRWKASTSNNFEIVSGDESVYRFSTPVYFQYEGISIEDFITGLGIPREIPKSKLEDLKALLQPKDPANTYKDYDPFELETQGDENADVFELALNRFIREDRFEFDIASENGLLQLVGLGCGDAGAVFKIKVYNDDNAADDLSPILTDLANTRITWDEVAPSS